jgi:N-acetylmuramoyl-L-alanine amidase
LFNYFLYEKNFLTPVCDQIPFVTRAEWGAREPSEPMDNMTTPVHHVFIHHTAAPDQCHDNITCTRDLHSIQNFHIDSRKWGDIGYNFVLGGDGRIYEGRGWSEIGAHTYHMNNMSVALCLIGNFEHVAPPQLMLDLAQKWIECGVEKGIIAKDYELHGHRDQNCTACPGQQLYNIIMHWKQFKGGKLPTYACSKK